MAKAHISFFLAGYSAKVVLIFKKKNTAHDGQVKMNVLPDTGLVYAKEGGLDKTLFRLLITCNRPS